jgi:hypothetical protein
MSPTPAHSPTRGVFEDFVAVINDADIDDLKPLPADVKCKPGRKDPISIQGMVLDAIDDGRLGSPQAMALLVMANSRIYGKFAGLCRVTPEGDLIAIGSVAQGGQ